MKLLTTSVITSALLYSGCTDRTIDKTVVIASGQMPSVVAGNDKNIHVVFGTGDSIMYSFSLSGGKDYSPPALIAVLPNLAASHMRGPQVAATSKGLVVTACTSSGDIYSYLKDEKGNWMQSAKVNDEDTVAKEGLMALDADGQNVFAVWLDLRDKHNKIFGARSTDGGKSWSKNSLVYASPDSTVCECCKPSVAMKGKNIYVMFRNWVNGNRDLYLIQSPDGGNTFGQAQKLGKESWKLDGCPMDGGSIVINDNGNVETVWKRKDNIYACEPGKPEHEIGEGRNCTVETANGKNIYAWTEKGEVVILKPQGVKKKLGEGSLPIIKSLDNEHIICVWENEKQIHSVVVEL